jgi:hypothetical protein
MLGCVLGLLTLALGLLLSGVLPRWVPLALLAFVVLNVVLGFAAAAVAVIVATRGRLGHPSQPLIPTALGGATGH